MKNTILFLIVIILFINCSNSKKITISDPILYNDALAGIIHNVQITVDSLENYLLTTKITLEQTPDSVFVLKNDIDTVLLNSLYKNSLKKIDWAKNELNKIEYKTDDYKYKASVLKGISMIDSVLLLDFKPLIDTLYTCNHSSYLQVVYAMIPYGKSSYTKYSAAFDTIMSAQMRFDLKNKYILEKNIIRFNF